MSEVKRYRFISSNGYAAIPVIDLIKAERYVEEQDFDRVTAERDAARGRAAALKDDALTLGCIVDSMGAERDALQQRLTAADERADVLEGLLRLARGAIGEDQWILLTKDIDAMLSQDAQRTNNSRNAHCPHDGICHTSEETCAEAQARIESLTAPAGAGQ